MIIQGNCTQGLSRHFAVARKGKTDVFYSADCLNVPSEVQLPAIYSMFIVHPQGISQASSQSSRIYSGFRVDGTDLKMSFTWGFI